MEDIIENDEGYISKRNLRRWRGNFGISHEIRLGTCIL